MCLGKKVLTKMRTGGRYVRRKMSDMLKGHRSQLQRALLDRVWDNPSTNEE